MAPARNINVHMLPALVEPADLLGKSVVVIDVLRATTTIIHALAAGAAEIVPCSTVEEAHRLADQLGHQQVVLGGERGGVRIQGFDLGNSPGEYTDESVGGKTVIFTTSNGTKAMLHCRLAREVLLAAFTNLSALGDAVADLGEVHLLCAGTGNRITREDVLLAGAITETLVTADGAGEVALNDQADLARDAWLTVADQLTRISLPERLRASGGGRNMLKIGQESDINIAADIDRLDIVPMLDVAQGRIRAR